MTSLATLDQARAIWLRTTEQQLTDGELGRKLSPFLLEGIVGQPIGAVEAGAATAAYTDIAGKASLLPHDWRDHVGQHLARLAREALWQPIAGQAQSRPPPQRFMAGRRRAPLPAIGFVPDYPIEAADQPLLTALLRSRGAQFAVSYSPQLDCWPNIHTGYHRAHERDHVTGYSALLDGLGDVVDTHRNGAGGRIYLHLDRAVVECADCNHVIATLGTPQARFRRDGTCSARRRAG
jgi:hypothetical protein